jgi:hypothetical protein
MVFDNILKLQKQWTDKFVIVDASRPELKRFDGQTGTVKTVNFSGRALVQFDGHNNIGWYDIDPSCLKIVDEPLAKPEGKAAKPAKADASVQEQKAAAPVKPIAKGKASAADILAAARTGAKPAAATTDPVSLTPPPKPAGKLSAADILAAARGGKAAPAAPTAEAPLPEPTPIAEPAKPAPAKVDPKKLSPADILAAARGKAPAAAAPAPAAPAPVAKAAPPKVEKPAPAKAPEPAPEPEPAPAPAPESSGGEVKSMLGKFKSNEEIIAFLRKGK